MADVTLKYKGATIGELSETGSKTLKTAGKYCDSDILLEYEKSSGDVQTEELYKIDIEEPTNGVVVPFDSDWNNYAAILFEFNNIKLSASDFIRVSINDKNIRNRGFYPNGSVRFTDLTAKSCAFSVWAEGLLLINDDNSNSLVSAQITNIQIFATTNTTNIEAGTIKIIGVR